MAAISPGPRTIDAALTPIATSLVDHSGLQVAGIVGGIRSENPWAGDTTSALFLNFTGQDER